MTESVNISDRITDFASYLPILKSIEEQTIKLKHAGLYEKCNSQSKNVMNQISVQTDISKTGCVLFTRKGVIKNYFCANRVSITQF